MRQFRCRIGAAGQHSRFGINSILSLLAVNALATIDVEKRAVDSVHVSMADRTLPDSTQRRGYLLLGGQLSEVFVNRISCARRSADSSSFASKVLKAPFNAAWMI
jgi:hypothetical protein